MSDIKKKKEVKLKIANIVLKVVSKDIDLGLRKDDPHKHFVVQDGTPDVVLEATLESIPKAKERTFKQKLFESGGVWNLHCKNGCYLINLRSATFGNRPYKAAVLSSDFTSGTIYCGGLDTQSHDLTYVLEYPLDEVIFMNLLSQGRGVEIHGCGCVDKHGQGLLFVGCSGAGKSTFANLWQKEKDAIVLSDDRIIIRECGGQFYMFGTPWHGDAGICSTNSVPLKRIYFLTKARQNRVHSLNRIVATSRLFQCCFPTFYDQSGLNFTTSYLDKITQRMPCHEFGFLPDRTAAQFICTFEDRNRLC